MTPGSLLVDSHGRVMRDLRISVTDRCNFRCMYCLPETEAAENFYRERWATAVNAAPIARKILVDQCGGEVGSIGHRRSISAAARSAVRRL